MRYCVPLVAAFLAATSVSAQYPPGPTPVVPAEKSLPQAGLPPRQGPLQAPSAGLAAPQFPQTAAPNAPPQSQQSPTAKSQPPALSGPAAPAPQSLPNSVTTTPPLLAKSREMTAFDHHLAEVHWMNGRWQLQAGDVWLKDFGSNEREAREALRVIQTLHLTQRGTIGSPTPIMEFWLTYGKAPRSLGTGLRVYPVDTASVRMAQVGNQWCVRDNRQLLFNFGIEQEAARQAVLVLQTYGFRQIGYVGYPHPSMIYFLGNASTDAGHTTSLHTPHIPVTHIQSQPVGSTPVQPEAAHVPGQPGSQVGQTGSPTAEKMSAKESMQARVYAQQLARGVRQLASPITGETSRFRFNPQQISVRQESQRWHLVNGNFVLADFGADGFQAQRALQLIRHYGCDEQCWVGKCGPTFSYFLVNGHAPVGVPRDTPGQTFRPDKVTVQRTVQGWVVSDGAQLAIPVGTSQEDAQGLVRAIQRYHFDFAGPLGPSMTFLARTR
jgi:hypothetical protein